MSGFVGYDLSQKNLPWWGNLVSLGMLIFVVPYLLYTVLAISFKTGADFTIKVPWFLLSYTLLGASVLVYSQTTLWFLSVLLLAVLRVFVEPMAFPDLVGGD